MRESRFDTSIDFWRRKRKMTWKSLAEQIPCSIPQLHRTAKSLTERSEGGKLAGDKIQRLATVLEVPLYQLYMTEEEAQKIS